MSILCLAVMLAISHEPEIKAINSSAWRNAVKFKIDPIRIREDGVEIVTIRMKIKPSVWIAATPQSCEFLQEAEARLTIKSQDPKTTFEVTYPKGTEVRSGGLDWTEYRGDVAFTAFVRRPKGDTSPLECELRIFGVDSIVPCLGFAKMRFTLVKK